MYRSYDSILHVTDQTLVWISLNRQRMDLLDINTVGCHHNIDNLLGKINNRDINLDNSLPEFSQ